jgi:hypothetical protein
VETRLATETELASGCKVSVKGQILAGQAVTQEEGLMKMQVLAGRRTAIDCEGDLKDRMKRRGGLADGYFSRSEALCEKGEILVGKLHPIALA